MRRGRRTTSRDTPWYQAGWRLNACAERLIGSIRREVLDHVVILGERHLRHLLLSYMAYYNEARTHLSLNKDAPVSREVQGAGPILAKLHLGGLHHQYVRI
jgi:hypothetical protein